ncbi:MAG: vWA domain-containing protein [Actinomycetaceae bacterium]|nr:vWA domain-containing protein [Actinomycetaceae bacterium]
MKNRRLTRIAVATTVSFGLLFSGAGAAFATDAPDTAPTEKTVAEPATTDKSIKPPADTVEKTLSKPAAAPTAAEPPAEKAADTTSPVSDKDSADAAAADAPGTPPAEKDAKAGKDASTEPSSDEATKTPEGADAAKKPSDKDAATVPADKDVTTPKVDAADVDKIKKDPPSGDLRKYVLKFASGIAGLDVAFVIDTTGSMFEDIDDAIRIAKENGSKIHDLNGRYAVVAYRDHGPYEEYVAKTILDFTRDRTAFHRALESLRDVNGGGDTDEAMLTALDHAINDLSWSKDAGKAAVVLTDAGFHDPDNGLTVDDLTSRKIHGMPISFYPVVDDYIADEYSDLATKTSGKVVTSKTGAADALSDVFAELAKRPIAFLPLKDYYVKPGGSVTLDASYSFINGKEAKYEWDLDGDGVYDVTTDIPSLSHVFGDKGDHSVVLRITGSNGTTSTTKAVVHVSDEAADPIGLATVTSLVASVASTDTDSTGTAKIEWKADTHPAFWMLRVDGKPIGVAPGSELGSLIAELPLGKTLEIALAPVSSDGVIGEFMTTLITMPDPPVKEEAKAEKKKETDKKAAKTTKKTKKTKKATKPGAELAVTGSDSSAMLILTSLMLAGGAVIIRRRTSKISL